MSSDRKTEVETLTGVVLGALTKKPAQTVTELKVVVDHRFRGEVPLTYVCIAICRLVNDGCVIFKEGRCSSAL